MPYNSNYDYINPLNTREYVGQFNKMTLNGKGAIKARPDMATINLGVETKGENLHDIQTKNAEISNNLINTLLDLGIKENDIQTYSYTINPEYDYVEGKQIFRGYRVVNNFKITVRDIGRVGTIIDAAVKSGANLAQNIEFGLSNESIYYNQALNLAIEDAIRKAQNIERRFGYVINKTPASIKEESFGQPIAMESAAFKINGGATTPVQRGLLEINASITAVFCYR